MRLTTKAERVHRNITSGAYDDPKIIMALAGKMAVVVLQKPDEPCPKCGGEGEVSVLPHEWTPESMTPDDEQRRELYDPDVESWIPCDFCNGTGVNP